nr:bi-domain-containing oxidoreductase [Pseudodesulfovibrio sp.]
MRQAFVKKGGVFPAEVPAPVVSEGAVLIKVVNSCISAGTELAGVQESGKSLIRRALKQPEKVAKVLNMVRTQGVAKTYAKVKGILDDGHPTGYSLAGVVIGVGRGVTDLKVGDRVAAAGAGIANHAEYVDVPRNLVMQIPGDLPFDHASTVTLGGIAMQGVRRAAPALGEFVVVFGTGLLGLFSVQMLKLCGARVIAVDLDESRLELARQFGAEYVINPAKDDAGSIVKHITNGYGADVVLFCAATHKSQALSDAFGMTRRKGRLVMVGVWGDKFNRDDIYKKEIDFHISTSYGPGRYDENYEQRGLDYPYAYVRWTENRNMSEFLRLLLDGRIDVASMINGKYAFEDVNEAFSVLSSEKKPLIVLLDYGPLPQEIESLANLSRCCTPDRVTGSRSQQAVNVAVVGAGGFAQGVHLPNLQKLTQYFTIQAICNRTGSTAQNVAKRFGAAYSTTDYEQVLADPDVDLVMICTRHNLHGSQVLKALKAGKHVFVEKPLCLDESELAAIQEFYAEEEDKPLLTVGFNRRYSKYIAEIRKHTDQRINPLFMHYRMNAGYLPQDHWVHTEEGGGRIVGEACHIVDLFASLAASSVKTYGAVSMTPSTGSVSSSDNKAIVLEYEDGSCGVVEYFSVGSKDLPKERLEVHFDEKTIIMDNFTSIEGVGVSLGKLTSDAPDKGLLEELIMLGECLTGSDSRWPISLESLIETTAITLEVK